MTRADAPSDRRPALSSFGGAIRRRVALLRREPDRGSTIPLIAAFCALGLAIILVATAATSLYIARKRLFTLADGASLAGAEAYDLDDVFAGEPGAGAAGAGTGTADAAPRAHLTDAEVADAVTAYLAAAPADGLADVHVESAGAPDGASARVELSAAWKPPVLTLFVPDGIRLDVVSTSRSVFH